MSDKKWRLERITASLPEVFSSIDVPKNGSQFRKFMSFVGPGLMVAVGYMDPGNWATDIAGGSSFGYTLLSVILISNLFAILLQHLALKLGIVTGRDLAQACKDSYSKPVSFILWILCEIAIAACDLAEVIGSAIALNLLFGIPLTIGIVITILDVLLLLLLQNKGFRYLEAFVAGLIFVIFCCFAYELMMSKPAIADVVKGLLPTTEIITNDKMLFIAIGILGATVMPHNLYLHSSIVQTRNFERTNEGKKEAIKYATIDSTVSLLLAFFINAAILILAASAFHVNGHKEVADINDAYILLEPVLGAKIASTFFAIALLASGQNSTLTGTLAGQIVMEGFINFKIKPWQRRLITRLIAVVPAFFVAMLYGEKGAGELLVISQVILSVQLSFAVVPLLQITGNKTKMAQFVNGKALHTIAWIIAIVIIGLNGVMLWNEFVR
jgi:manganese transport protein